MERAFMYLMHNGSFSSEQKLMSSLRSLVYCMANKYDLTNDDQGFCLFVFWKEYNKGCATPMPDLYIKNTLIPAIFSFGKLDVALGASILMMVERN